MVGCDSCDFWIHDRCDNEAARILSNTRGNAEPYSCPMCRSAQQAKVPAAHIPLLWTQCLMHVRTLSSSSLVYSLRTSPAKLCVHV